MRTVAAGIVRAAAARAVGVAAMIAVAVRAVQDPAPAGVRRSARLRWLPHLRHRLHHVRIARAAVTVPAMVRVVADASAAVTAAVATKTEF